MSRANDADQHPLPGPPAGPSEDLQARAEDGLARFMARWEDPTEEALRHDQADDVAEDR